MTLNTIRPQSFKLQALGFALLLSLTVSAVENPANVGVYSVPVSSKPASEWGGLAATTELPVNAESVSIINSLYDMVCERLDVPRFDYVGGDGRGKTIPFSTPAQRREIAENRDLDKGRFFNVFHCVVRYLLNRNDDAGTPPQGVVAPTAFPLSFGSVQSVEILSSGWQAQGSTAAQIENLDSWPQNVELGDFTTGAHLVGDLTVANAFRSFCSNCGLSAVGDETTGPQISSGLDLDLCWLNGHSASEYLHWDGMEDRLAYVVPYAANRILSALDTRWFAFTGDPLILTNSFSTIVQTNVYLLAGNDISAWVNGLPKTGSGSYSETFDLGAATPIVVVESETAKESDFFTSDEVLGFGETQVPRAYVDYELLRTVHDGQWQQLTEDYLGLPDGSPGYVRVVTYLLESVTTTEIGERTVFCDVSTSVRTAHRKTVYTGCVPANAVIASTDAQAFVDHTRLFYGAKRTDTHRNASGAEQTETFGRVDQFALDGVSLAQALPEINGTLFDDPEDETTRDEGRVPSAVVSYTPISPGAIAATKVSYFRTEKYVFREEDPEAGEHLVGGDFFEREFFHDWETDGPIYAFYRGGGTPDIDDISIGKDEADAENSKLLVIDPIIHAPPGHVRLPLPVSLEWPEDSHVGNSVRHDFSRLNVIGNTRFKFIKW